MAADAEPLRGGRRGQHLEVPSASAAEPPSGDRVVNGGLTEASSSRHPQPSGAGEGLPPPVGPPPPIVQTKSRRRARWWWVAGGAAVGVVVLGVIGAIPRDDELSEHFGLAVGDCLPDVLPAETIEEVATIPCSDPHVGEVFALVHDGAGDSEPYPGDAAMRRRAGQSCVDAFPAYAGMTMHDAGLDLMTNSPSDDSWETGDRVTICLLHAVEGDLVGSPTPGTSRRSAPAGAPAGQLDRGRLLQLRAHVSWRGERRCRARRLCDATHIRGLRDH